jgi:hypothetical protein
MIALDEGLSEEEWLVKAAPPVVRPLPRVPKLKLSLAKDLEAGTLSTRNPPTLSARAGINARPLTARGSGSGAAALTARRRPAPLTARPSSGAKTVRSFVADAAPTPPPLLAPGGAQRAGPTPRLLRPGEVHSNLSGSIGGLQRAASSSSGGEEAAASRIPKPNVLLRPQD